MGQGQFSPAKAVCKGSFQIVLLCHKAGSKVCTSWGPATRHRVGCFLHHTRAPLHCTAHMRRRWKGQTLYMVVCSMSQGSQGWTHRCHRVNIQRWWWQCSLHWCRHCQTGPVHFESNFCMVCTGGLETGKHRVLWQRTPLGMCCTGHTRGGLCRFRSLPSGSNLLHKGGMPHIVCLH